MKTKKVYIAPVVEEFAFESEEGFATSIKLRNLGDFDFNEDGQEDWTEDDDTFGGISWQ
jgi:hypothetical protein